MRRALLVAIAVLFASPSSAATMQMTYTGTVGSLFPYAYSHVGQPFTLRFTSDGDTGNLLSTELLVGGVALEPHQMIIVGPTFSAVVSAMVTVALQPAAFLFFGPEPVPMWDEDRLLWFTPPRSVAAGLLNATTYENIAAVPIPAGGLLLGSAVAAVLWAGRRRQAASFTVTGQRPGS